MKYQILKTSEKAYRKAIRKIANIFFFLMFTMLGDQKVTRAQMELYGSDSVYKNYIIS